MALPMKKTMMYLPDELHRYLQEEAARSGSSMAEVAREAIAEYRAAHEKPAQRDYSAIIGVIDVPGPPTDDTMHIDEVLAEYYRPGGAWDREHDCADVD